MKYRTGHIYKRGAKYYLKYMVDGRMVYTKLDATTLEGARAEQSKKMKGLRATDVEQSIAIKERELRQLKLEKLAEEDSKTPPLKIDAAWKEFHDSPSRSDAGDSTLHQYDCQYRRFQAWVSEAHPAVKFLRQVTPEMAEGFAKHLTKEGRSANTFNKYMNFLQMLFDVLADRAKMPKDENPWRSIKRKHGEQHSRRELSRKELDMVCQAATGEMRLLFALGIYTGMRLGDCATLNWKDIDLQRKVITRMPAKSARRTGKLVHIPMHPVLAAMLGEIPERARHGHVLPDSAAAYDKHPSYLCDKVQLHFTDCGLKTLGHKAPGRVKAPVEVGFHSLRHTFVSLCREANAPLSVVEAIVGHSNPAMTRHYTHTSEEAAASAVRALPSTFGSVPAAAAPAPPPDMKHIRAQLEGMTAKNWMRVRGELLAATAVRAR